MEKQTVSRMTEINGEIAKIDQRIRQIKELEARKNALIAERRFLSFLVTYGDGTAESDGVLLAKYFQMHYGALRPGILLTYGSIEMSRELVEAASSELLKSIKFCKWENMRLFIDKVLQYVFGSNVGSSYSFCIANTVNNVYRRNKKPGYLNSDAYWEIKGNTICTELIEVNYVKFAEFLSAVVEKFKEDSDTSGVIANK